MAEEQDPFGKSCLPGKDIYPHFDKNYTKLHILPTTRVLTFLKSSITKLKTLGV